MRPVWDMVRDCRGAVAGGGKGGDINPARGLGPAGSGSSSVRQLETDQGLGES